MLSSAIAPEQAIQLLNLGARGGQTVFDAAMPDGSYSDLVAERERPRLHRDGNGDGKPAAGGASHQGRRFHIVRSHPPAARPQHGAASAAFGFPLSPYPHCRTAAAGSHYRPVSPAVAIRRTLIRGDCRGETDTAERSCVGHRIHGSGARSGGPHRSRSRRDAGELQP